MGSVEAAAGATGKIGTLLSRRARGRDWVSKSDMVQFIRCPYAFVQVDQGLLPRDALIDPLSVQLIDEGNEFHRNVTALAAPMPDDLSLEDAFAQEVTLFGVPVLENKALKLLGAPDAVRAEGGALVPIEIKSHKDVRRTDLLELAFYWLLLEPFRTREGGQPRGEMMLRRDGVVETVPVTLDSSHFAEVEDLIKQIRRARRVGVKPRVCGCPACRGPLLEQVTRLTREGKDLSLIWGIAGKRARALEELGIATYEDLIATDGDEVAAGLRELGHTVSARTQVRQWRSHALAYQLADAVVFGPPAPVEDSFIALDLEYDPIGPPIWTIGLLVCDGDHREHVALWAENETQERENLLALDELLARHSDLPILTWGGVAADLPQLQHGAERHRLDGRLLAAVSERHFDLFLHVTNSLRLPMPGLGLKDVADYFGVAKTSTIQDGLEALFLFAQYQQSRNRTEKQNIRERLVDYNRDDLEMLARAHQAIRLIQVLAQDNR